MDRLGRRIFVWRYLIVDRHTSLCDHIVGLRIVGADLSHTYILVYSDDMKRVAEKQLSRDEEESLDSQDSEEVCVCVHTCCSFLLTLS